MVALRRIIESADQRAKYFSPHQFVNEEHSSDDDENMVHSMVTFDSQSYHEHEQQHSQPQHYAEEHIEKSVLTTAPCIKDGIDVNSTPPKASFEIEALPSIEDAPSPMVDDEHVISSTVADALEYPEDPSKDDITCIEVPMIAKCEEIVTDKALMSSVPTNSSESLQ